MNQPSANLPHPTPGADPDNEQSVAFPTVSRHHARPSPTVNRFLPSSINYHLLGRLPRYLSPRVSALLFAPRDIMSAHQQQQQQQRYHLGTPSSVLAPSPLLTQTAVTRRVTNSQPYDSGSSENSSQSEESPTLSTPMFPAHRERVGPRVRGNVSTRNPPQSSNHTARPSQTSPSFGRVGPAPNEKSVPSRYPQAKPSHIVHQQGMHGEKSSSSSHHSTHLYYAAPNMSIWQSLEPEDDDWMHNPDPKRDRKEDKRIGACSARGVCDVGTMIVIMLACLALFAGEHPSDVHHRRPESLTQIAFPRLPRCGHVAPYLWKHQGRMGTRRNKRHRPNSPHPRSPRSDRSRHAIGGSYVDASAHR